MTNELKSIVERLKSVSHPLRLRMLALLNNGELCVCQVAETLEIPPSSASEALRELRRAGFVTERKEGRWVFVTLVGEAAAPPMLKGILAEAVVLREARRDLIRARKVKAIPIPNVCTSAMKGQPS